MNESSDTDKFLNEIKEIAKIKYFYNNKLGKLIITNIGLIKIHKYINSHKKISILELLNKIQPGLFNFKSENFERSFLKTACFIYAKFKKIKGAKRKKFLCASKTFSIYSDKSTSESFIDDDQIKQTVESTCQSFQDFNIMLNSKLYDLEKENTLLKEYEQSLKTNDKLGLRCRASEYIFEKKPKKIHEVFQKTRKTKLKEIQERTSNALWFCDIKELTLEDYNGDTHIADLGMASASMAKLEYKHLPLKHKRKIKKSLHIIENHHISETTWFQIRKLHPKLPTWKLLKDCRDETDSELQIRSTPGRLPGCQLLSFRRKLQRKNTKKVVPDLVTSQHYRMESNDDSIGRYPNKSCVKDSCSVLDDLFSFILKMIVGKMVLSCEANDVIHCKISSASNESNATLMYHNNSFTCRADGLEGRENDVNDLMSSTSLLNRKTDFVMFANDNGEDNGRENMTKAILNDMFCVILDILSGTTLFTSTTQFNSREHNIFARENRPGLSLVHSDRATGEKSSEQMETINVNTRSKRHHIWKKTRQCEYCGKAFPRPALVKIHDGIYTRERPNKCAYCGKAFSIPAHVKGHESHHLCKFC